MIDFFYVVAVVSLVYVISVRFLRAKFVDMSKVKRFQEEMNELNKKFREASKRKDVNEMERISKEQVKMIPKMRMVMMEQFKMTFVVLVVFLVFIYALGLVDPLKQDDYMLDFSNNSAFRTSFVLEHNVYEIDVNVVDVEGGKHNAKLFVSTDYPVDPELKLGKAVVVLDKPVYDLGDRATLTIYNATSVSAKTDNGTALHIGLPFNILGLRFVHGTQGVFIFLAFIFGLLLSPFFK